MRCADWSFKLRSYLGAVDQRYQEESATPEAPSTPRLNATLDSEGSALSTQMYYILVMTTAGAALDKCHNAGVNEGFEDWRQAVRDGVGAQASDEVCGIPDECVGVPIQRRQFQKSQLRSREPYTTTRTNQERPKTTTSR